MLETVQITVADDELLSLFLSASSPCDPRILRSHRTSNEEIRCSHRCYPLAQPDEGIPDVLPTIRSNRTSTSREGKIKRERNYRRINVKKRTAR